MAQIAPSFATFSSSHAPINSSRKPIIKLVSSAFEHDEDYDPTSNLSSSGRGEKDGSGTAGREGRSTRRTGGFAEEKEPPTCYASCLLGDENGAEEIVVYSSQKKIKVKFQNKNTINFSRSQLSFLMKKRTEEGNCLHHRHQPLLLQHQHLPAHQSQVGKRGSVKIKKKKSKLF